MQNALHLLTFFGDIFNAPWTKKAKKSPPSYVNLAHFSTKYAPWDFATQVTNSSEDLTMP